MGRAPRKQGQQTKKGLDRRTLLVGGGATVGLLLANVIGIGLGEWKHAPARARTCMYSGIAVLLAAIVLLGRAGV